MSARRGIITVFTGIALSGCALYIDEGDDGPGDPPGDDTPDDPPDDPPGMTPFTTSDPGIAEMALDATHLYWVDSGGVDGQGNLRRIARAGGAIETLYSDPQRIYALALDDAHVYIVLTPGGAGNYAGSVVRVAKADASATTLTGGFNPTSVTVDGGWVYYSEAVSPDGAIWRIAATGGTPELVVDDVDNPWDLHAAGGVLYYSEMNAGRMMRVDGAGGTPTVLAEGGWVGTNWMTVGGDHVYFSACPSGECSPGYLYRVPRAGGEVEQLLNAGWPTASGKIAVTEGAILWGDRLLPAEGGQIDVMPVESTPENNVLVEAVAGEGGEFYFAEFYSGDIYRVD